MVGEGSACRDALLGLGLLLVFRFVCASFMTKSPAFCEGWDGRLFRGSAKSVRTRGRGGAQVEREKGKYIDRLSPWFSTDVVESRDVFVQKRSCGVLELRRNTGGSVS